LEVDANYIDVLDREVVALINQDLNAGEPHRAIFNASMVGADIYFYLYLGHSDKKYFPEKNNLILFV
jgi:hypothetical protein